MGEKSGGVQSASMNIAVQDRSILGTWPTRRHIYMGVHLGAQGGIISQIHGDSRFGSGGESEEEQKPHQQGIDGAEYEAGVNRRRMRSGNLTRRLMDRKLRLYCPAINRYADDSTVKHCTSSVAPSPVHQTSSTSRLVHQPKLTLCDSPSGTRI